jgi:hypothetical protein
MKAAGQKKKGPRKVPGAFWVFDFDLVDQRIVGMSFTRHCPERDYIIIILMTMIVVASADANGRLAELKPALMNFGAIDLYITRSGDADPNAITLDGDDRHADVPIDNDLFARST